ncbi:putative DUF1618 domain containing family protein [Zea mays]|uniref:DUF1618 domain-containing protein n=1 Tax=Zea mays TaxID=4577 RepID=B4FBP2_MAIZE|nr:putative DUF1618 domain containing family protein [Zea mays]ACF79535.1 unknown [Zea mays]ONM17525.1 hypothetical protein ZEAMMB73_Zm00001d003696 [Zea mays]|eukprot:NP_001131217.1 putative DUF1618 domain containing family protein [Zea mays]
MSAIGLVQGSRAGKEAKQEPESEQEADSEPHQRKWVALVSVPVLLGNADDDRAQAMALGTDVQLDLKDPPLPSYLVLHPRVSPNPRSNEEPLSAYILAADRSGYILLQVVEGNRPDFFLCDTHSRTVTIIPPVCSYLRTGLDIDIRPNLSIGLIADPLQGHYVVAQLHPATLHRYRLLCYSTAKREWNVRYLTRQEDHLMINTSIDNAVLAHNGCLWWIALGYGIFFCDPVTPVLELAELRFLPFPAGCQMNAYASLCPKHLKQRRCVRPSEGKLRFVEIRGFYCNVDWSIRYDDVLFEPTVRMWTLEDPERPDPWTLEYEVPLADIWNNETYANARLPPGEVPQVALVDPNNHCVVYFFQGSKLFGFDMQNKQVIACKKCLIDRNKVIMFQSSRPIVDAWELSSPPPFMLSEDDGDLSSEDIVFPRGKKRRVCKFVHSWTSSRPVVGRTWKIASPPPDASSHTSGDQADDAPSSPKGAE